MKAIVFTKYGPPDVLQIRDIEKPVPGDDEVLVKVHAAEVTKADCEMRSLDFQVKWFLPSLRLYLGLIRPRKQVLGAYFSGEVEATGKAVSSFRPGERVFGATRMRLGAHSEYLCLPASYTIAPKPDNISFAEAAAVPLGGLNALHFMRRANIRIGEKVLVNGAGGSIGIFAVQIAKAMGAEVTAVDSSIKENMLRRIGATHFIDYAREDFTANGHTYDVIFSMVARTPYAECINALNDGGRYIMANPRVSDMLRSVLTSWLTGKKAIFAFAGEKLEELLVLKEMIQDGAIKPVVDNVYPYEQAAKAHYRVETEQRLGTVVISSAPDEIG
jgi:NADPH:quinone reductase-like Zn-dependent oxidoreductase